ncbi:MAG: Crossover junction endodeoxyribonuclease RuvC [candidate division CPR2 bacterium GW2011_GWC1_41_48]|uniref:Crossover junction endodeoxyribonuclease RuvC n=1 Tax=candidate division CPR2 bacterium GW2011_GWC1_41_48 TaxID=1618344 RepID=A0A0G0W6H8_UNCC2|nr:MAG: Crossover junction endodeoxyribonuclease RuvC [candidate division CPR2 bacterium GW2011_GWC2_39_35]KKR27867.1 MAG: Crossover junction endodeoxyribonuclease RuvC [candidate division CPR2 bacterium GW2011_GWD1_39_7]KKS08580.1 MAG: Crossover junction endodeoxyribonuclease RuvC [candidate division CPR2 bacterium GW2011_GWC1_41_48]OGB60053.1 MAG: crossover junction endodeoxyribonuclease RuvC [candidate division CPR2 bacterium GWD1_39_7]HCL99849.1 crossover junction endodeoxyribonuclease RuvC
MIILGVDPGTATTGYGLVDYSNGKLKAIEYGCILTPAKTDLHLRLKTISEDLREIIDQFKPDVITVEQLFFCSNVKTALTVGHARGVILLAIADSNTPFSEYTPLQVKQAISGYGKAGKKQVQEMVKIILNLSEIPKPDDAADALAIAICHANSHKLNSL